MAYIRDSCIHMAGSAHGMVARPQSLTLDDLKNRRLHEVEFTLECSGNNGNGLAFFTGGIGNARSGEARV